LIFVSAAFYCENVLQPHTYAFLCLHWLIDGACFPPRWWKLLVGCPLRDVRVDHFSYPTHPRSRRHLIIIGVALKKIFSLVKGPPGATTPPRTLSPPCAITALWRLRGNCSVLGCVTQCSQSAAHSCEQFLQVQQIFVTLGPLRHA